MREFEPQALYRTYRNRGAGCKLLNLHGALCIFLNAIDKELGVAIPSMKLVPMVVLLYLLWIWLLICSSARSQICRERIYGNVHPLHCLMAFNEWPFAQHSSTSNEHRGPRIFSEPQFQIPQFDTIINSYRPQAIVQLPKIWKACMFEHMVCYKI